MGNDLTIPSPFKERDKRRKGLSSYRDEKNRLSVTVALNGDQPVIMWQCWYTKRADGTNFGGMSAYAVSLATGKTAAEVLQALDMRFDEAVEAADSLEDRVIAILGQGQREEARRNVVVAPVVRKPRQPPPRLHPLFQADPETEFVERFVEGRRIDPRTAAAYGLAYDPGAGAVFIPWRARNGDHVYHQWWDPTVVGRNPYRFPPRDGEHLDHGDAIFGIDLWRPGMPLVLCEGVFDAMTLMACGLGGSHLTDAQTAIIMSLSPRPRMIVLALDRDDAGVNGSKRIAGALSNRMPDVEVLQVFPPPPKDWNDLAQRDGADAAAREFVSRVKEAHEGYQGGSDIMSRVRQMLG